MICEYYSGAIGAVHQMEPDVKFVSSNRLEVS